jgi:hemolysin III
MTTTVLGTTIVVEAKRSQEFAACSRSREVRIDLALHLLGLVAAAIGCAILLPLGVVSDSVAYVFGVSLYAVGLLAMLICSALYNGWTQARCRHLLRRLDQGAIFLLIAGTYSPFMTSAIDDPLVAVVYAGICATSAFGLVALFRFPRLFDTVYPWIYVVLGWAVVVVMGPLSSRLSPMVVALICVGGLLYTVGLIFHMREKPYDTPIWHGFVLAAAGCHYLAVFNSVPSL